MASRNKKRLVIDADIAARTGSLKSNHLDTRSCREFLNATFKYGHKMVLTEEIKDEWKRNSRGFARRWMVQMVNRRRLEEVTPAPLEVLREEVLSATNGSANKRRVKKDFRLVEAARATDQTIASCDEQMRTLLSTASKVAKGLKRIVWVNPEKRKEKPLEWLRDGAKHDSFRKLGASSA